MPFILQASGALGVTTLLTGFFNGLLLFIALRILTGLGEGVLYSNDRSFIAQVTPPKKMGLGMGIVISGLSVGLTAGLLVTPYIIEMCCGILEENAWKAPFFILGTLTIIIGFILKKYLIKTEERGSSDVKNALLKYWTLFSFVPFSHPGGLLHCRFL